MFFVNDDQTEIRIGQEQGRARSDNHFSLAARHGAPSGSALYTGQIRMPQGRRTTETLSEPFQPLGAKGNLRQQDERLFVTFERLRDRLEIHLGLAGSWHTLENGRLEGASQYVLTHGCCSGGLSG